MSERDMFRKKLNAKFILFEELRAISALIKIYITGTLNF